MCLFVLWLLRLFCLKISFWKVEAQCIASLQIIVKIPLNNYKIFYCHFRVIWRHKKRNPEAELNRNLNLNAQPTRLFKIDRNVHYHHIY
jgi:hypothetical protein